MRKTETNRHCKYYSYGDVAPTAYGAFCTYKKVKCFTRRNGVLSPQCYGCKNFKRG